ncbi:MAG: glycosyltransferase [Mycobacteriales bacterium]
MFVGICDFPGAYAFPPSGYGGIERWLWAVAVGARKAVEDVHLLGPQWRSELAEEWPLRSIRLEDTKPGSKHAAALKAAGYDLLVVGHEYPSLSPWRAAWEVLDCDVVTFQHWPYFRHKYGAFDGVQARLYCYSEEMRTRYAAHRPITELAVHLGLDEGVMPARSGDSLLWMGRIDTEKAPHLAIRAARLLGRKIIVAGPVFDTAYVDAHRADFAADHVTLVGEVGGPTKAGLLAEASALIYTCARGYIEAGAASFGESLRAGTPVAALAWRPGSCSHAALCERTGHVAQVETAADDDHVAQALAETIEKTHLLCAAEVQDVGLARFDPVRHFRSLATRQC